MKTKNLLIIVSLVMALSAQAQTYPTSGRLVNSGTSSVGHTTLSNSNGVLTLGGYLNSDDIGLSATSGITLIGGTLSLSSVGTSGTYGDATHTLTISTNAAGQVVSVTSNAINPAGIGADAAGAAAAVAAASIASSGGTGTGITLNGTTTIGSTITGGTNAQSTFSASAPVFQGSNITMPNQTLTGATSVMTEGLADARYGSPTASTPFFSSTDGASYIIRSTSNSHLYSCEGYVTFSTLNCSIKISPAYAATDLHLRAFGIQDIGNCDWVQMTNQTLLFTAYLSRASGPSPQGGTGASSRGALQYTFSSPFSCAAGDTIVLSPSGHTFTTDAALTSGTIVAIRDLPSSPIPTTSDTSLKVNGGSSITTTYVSNTATGNGTYIPWVIYWNTADGVRCYSRQESAIYYQLQQVQ